MVIEAGGIVTGYAGEPFDPFAHELVASNRHLHPVLLQTIRTTLETEAAS